MLVFQFFSWKIKIISFKNSDFACYWGSPLVQFSKYNDFLCVCWFLGKNLSNFVSPDLKLHNMYCHKYRWGWWYYPCQVHYSSKKSSFPTFDQTDQRPTENWNQIESHSNCRKFSEYWRMYYGNWRKTPWIWNWPLERSG